MSSSRAGGGPLAKAAVAVEAGAVIRAIDGVELTGDRNAWSLLAGKAGDRVRLTVEAPDGAQTDHVVKPISSGAESQSAENDTQQRGEQEQSEEDLEALQQELQRAAEESGQGEEQQQMSEAELAELRAQQEQEQAMEQWLRRIPDDPGGLLRRKFRYQYQRSGKDQDGNSVWPDNEVQPW